MSTYPSVGNFGILGQLHGSVLGFYVRLYLHYLGLYLYLKIIGVYVQLETGSGVPSPHEVRAEHGGPL